MLIYIVLCFPALSQLQEPMLGTNADDSFSIQPLAGYPDRLQGVTNATTSAHLSTTPPTNLVTSATSPPPPSSSQNKPPLSTSAAGGAANPYRIGTGFGSRKPAYGASGIASFGGSTSVAPPTSQSLTQQPPMMVPSQPIQPTPSVQTSQGAGLVPQAPPTSGPSPYQSAPPYTTGPPTDAHIHTSAPVPVVEPQQWSGGGGWDHASQPVRHHWFYLRSGEKYWIPFSLVDSQRLEEGLVQHHNTSEEVRLENAHVPTFIQCTCITWKGYTCLYERG